MDVDKVVGTNYGFLWAAISTTSFFASNLLLRRVVPSCAKKTKSQEWKWRNTANSLLHSFIAGSWSCFCFWQTPVMREDLISKYSTSSHVLCSVTTGYFIYDFFDMALNHRKRSSYELMFHHIIAIVCFGLCINTRYYLGYGLVALLVEVNSVFLHIRQLMLVQGVPPKDHILYRVNTSLNLATFVIFRIATLGWMTRWLILHKDELSAGTFNLGIISVAVIISMSVVLLLRVIMKDYVSRPHVQCGNINQLLSEESTEYSTTLTDKTN
ncbi:TLC domain-containing protein 2-like [Ischnura elegans]|uniref:TLC domain-containing protein 2-like n=1 Tax=Ischnura elegans TaxID=197161 RepID=UPI001ED89EA2|nr:TLC domain-containing protein 2-like [Ischnura elegans]